MEQKKFTLADEQEPRELNSWKEIAHHLGVNVGTAQKWEQARELPVRRAPGARGRVSTDTASVNVWKQKLAVTNPEEHYFRWPLGRSIAVEVRFLSEKPRPSDIDLLCDYLDLFKSALD